MPWQPDTLSGIVEELLAAAEQNRVGAFLARCQEAKITGKLLQEIERDAQFPKGAKVLLKQSIPRVIAKYLNKAGVSAEYQDELAIITALLLIVQNNRSMNKRFDEVIEAQKNQEKKL